MLFEDSKLDCMYLWTVITKILVINKRKTTHFIKLQKILKGNKK